METASHACKSVDRFTNTTANTTASSNAKSVAARTSNGEVMRVLGLKSIKYALQDIVENPYLEKIDLFALNS